MSIDVTMRPTMASTTAQCESGRFLINTGSRSPDLCSNLLQFGRLSRFEPDKIAISLISFSSQHSFSINTLLLVLVHGHHRAAMLQYHKVSGCFGSSRLHSFCLTLLKYLLTFLFPQALCRYVIRPARRLMTYLCIEIREFRDCFLRLLCTPGMTTSLLPGNSGSPLSFLLHFPLHVLYRLLL